MTASSAAAKGNRAAALFVLNEGDNVKSMNKQIVLDPRLQKCAAFVRTGVKAADIGTDHGYLPIALLQSGKATAAIAADINEAPLESARRNAIKYGETARMRFVLTDGLNGLNANDADDIIIAGMGGELILRIVSEAAWLRDPNKHLVLQPMTTAAQLRAGLAALGFQIDREEAVFDGKKIYSVLSVFYTGEVQEAPTPLFVHMGAIRPGSEHSARYAESVSHNLSNKLKGVQHAGGDTDTLRTVLVQIHTLYMEGREEYDG